MGHITLTTSQDFVLKCCSESTFWSLMEATKKTFRVTKKQAKKLQGYKNR